MLYGAMLAVSRFITTPIRNLIREERNGAALLFSTERSDGEDAQDYIPAENKVLEIVIAVSLYAAGESIPLSLWQSGKRVPQKIGSMSDFEDYYAKTPEISFGRTGALKTLLSDPAVSGEIAELPVIFMVDRKISEELYSAALRLSEQGHTVILYIVTDDTLPEYAAGVSERLMVVPVGTDRDLREVL